ncbi:60Kd inner membrane protein-domain-containing protein [Peziza echinospora]|nr:60Kd inner membrane protein-domain-containing protein [Peziza echinospora]
MPPPRLSPGALLRLQPLRPQFHHHAHHLRLRTTTTTTHIQSRTFMTALLTTTSTTLSTLAAHLPAPTPWYILIPLTAITLRTLTTLPLTLYARRITHTTLKLQPLLNAWGRVIQKTVSSGGGAGGAMPMQEWERVTNKMVNTRRAEVLGRWGAQRWKMWLGLGQMPVWVLATFTLRGMATPHSKTTLEDGGHGSVPTTTTTTTTITTNSIPTTPSGGGTGIPGAVSESAIAAEEPAATGFAVIGQTIQGWLDAIPVEQSLAEGGALWFKNLLEPDPLYILPLALSFVIFANIEFSALQFTRSGRLMTILRTAMRIFPLLVIPITMQTPTALTLYWISSATYSLIQNLILHFWYPLPKPVTPCSPAVGDKLKPAAAAVAGKSGGGGGGGMELPLAAPKA